MATWAMYFHPTTTTDTMVPTNNVEMHHQIASSTIYPTPTFATPSPTFQAKLLAPPLNKTTTVSSPPSHDTSDAMAIDHPPPNPQTISLFFRLPAELRNKIYTALLCPNYVPLKTLTKSTDHDHTHTTSPPPLHPSILSTCRLIAAEASPLLYTHNTFHAHPSLLTSLPHYYTSPSSLPVCHPDPLRLITRWQLSLRLDTDAMFTAKQAARAFSGAEYLEVRVWQEKRRDEMGEGRKGKEKKGWFG
ncbi:hypothetical protein CC80DRAFT_489173 [Byssothecium circinans]|uniref:2EXR domain-containing protein n=1 Tax=Byssothecium circinans TaxID=147558 RepID=A0A6A5UAT2_9PLEO|nr:hypothetical protein CC80DRAFT_489173 [Byssothecium circinans]